MFLNIVFFFYFLILFSALLVTFSNNPIHSVLFLISVFVNVSIIFILFNIDFLGLLILIVYVGAIAILFLFMVMMLNIKKIENEYHTYLLIGLIILCTSLLYIFYFYYFKLNTIIFLNDNISFFNDSSAGSYNIDKSINYTSMVDEIMSRFLELEYEINKKNIDRTSSELQAFSELTGESFREKNGLNDSGTSDYSKTYVGTFIITLLIISSIIIQI